MFPILILGYDANSRQSLFVTIGGMLLTVGGYVDRKAFIV
jgi:hypothetical protein